jgi:hypothetical protein
MTLSALSPSEGERQDGEWIAESHQTENNVNEKDHRRTAQASEPNVAGSETKDHHHGYCQRARKRARRCEAWIRRHRGTIETIAAAIIAVFTTALAIVSYQQWGTTRVSNRLTRESNHLTRLNMEASLRPWVLVNDWTWMGTEKGPIPSPPLVRSDIVAVRVGLQNAGRLPATYMYGLTEALTLDLDVPFPQDPPYLQPENPGSLATIAPGQTVYISADLREQPLASVNAGRYMLYVYGYVKYWDQFLTERGLVFCGMWGKGTAGWTPCPSYNIPW